MPLHQATSELFQSLGRPVRIRVLELLDDGPRTVRRLIDAIRIGQSRLSQQLAVLRGTGLVVARRVLTHLVLGQGRLLADLRVGHAS